MTRLSELERFEAKFVDRGPDLCWEWTAFKNPGGYGTFSAPGTTGTKMVLAHRYAHFLATGDWPAQVDHKCRNRGCVNPGHLQPTSSKENAENKSALSSTLSGYRGVTWHAPSRKWVVKVRHLGRLYHGGYFESLSDAVPAVRALRLELHTNNISDRKDANA